MQIITKNIRWRVLMETYHTAKLDRSLNNLSRDSVNGRNKNKKNKKAKNCVDLHADLISTNTEQHNLASTMLRGNCYTYLTSPLSLRLKGYFLGFR